MHEQPWSNCDEKEEEVRTSNKSTKLRCACWDEEEEEEATNSSNTSHKMQYQLKRGTNCLEYALLTLVEHRGGGIFLEMGSRIGDDGLLIMWLFMRSNSCSSPISCRLKPPSSITAKTRMKQLSRGDDNILEPPTCTSSVSMPYSVFPCGVVRKYNAPASYPNTTLCVYKDAWKKVSVVFICRDPTLTETVAFTKVSQESVKGHRERT